MTGCCRNGSWPSRGQDNNLPAIYFSSSFSDRKKPAKNTPYIFMVCVVTLGSHIVQPLAQRRVNAGFRPGYSGLSPIRSGKLLKLEILQPLYAACSNACLSSCEKTFPCVKLEPSMFYSLRFRSASYIWSYFVMSPPWKCPPHGCCCWGL